MSDFALPRLLGTGQSTVAPATETQSEFQVNLANHLLFPLMGLRSTSGQWNCLWFIGRCRKP